MNRFAGASWKDAVKNVEKYVTLTVAAINAERMETNSSQPQLEYKPLRVSIQVRSAPSLSIQYSLFTIHYSSQSMFQGKILHERKY